MPTIMNYLLSLREYSDSMSILKTKGDYKTGKLSKAEFIGQMHEFHKVLFDFSENLKDTEIGSIEIADNKVIFTTRKTDFHPGGLSFYVDVHDKRVTPVDTFNFDYYEREDSEMLYRVVKNGDVIFDVGANIGWYSNHLSRKLPDSKIYSFEPIPETFEQLKRNVELNKSSNITLNNFALAEERKTLTFYYSPLVTGASSSQNITENPDMKKLECKADTLDNYVASNQIEKIDFLKCDVEGAELFVYKGGVETFKKFKPAIFTEMLRKWAAKFNYHPNDIIKLFTDIGYKCFASSAGKLKWIEKVTDETVETNFFFLHAEKHAEKIKQLT